MQYSTLGQNQAYFPYKTIHEMFEAQVEKTPDNVAIVFKNKKITYRELNSKAYALARKLIDKGIASETIVAICFYPSIEMVISILGILKAGGAYLPIDPDYPAKRIEFILKDSQAALLITSEHDIKCELNIPVICFKNYEDEDFFVDKSTNNKSIVTPKNLLYMIYTSGTTGNPKGMKIEHLSFSNLLNWYIKDFGINSDDKVLLITSICFDLTQKNLYAPLVTGGELHLIEKYDPLQISNVIKGSKISFLNCTPSGFYPIIDESALNDFRDIKSLRYVLLGGEFIKYSRIRDFIKADNFVGEMVNIYGPTECTDIVSFYRINKTHNYIKGIPIGKPIYNSNIYIIDEGGNIMPQGAEGEVCIGGIPVGRCYHDRPELNEQRFINHPTKGRIYRTGDIGKQRDDGNIELVGRIDDQIKVRGYRIETREIENHLQAYKNIKEAVVLLNNEEDLTAYYVTEVKINITELRKYLAEFLPTYMIPTNYVWLKAIPLNNNGKIDRKTLLDWKDEIEITVVDCRELDKIEQRLYDLWDEILHFKFNVNITENFFDLGGNSLKLIVLRSKILKEFDMEFTIQELFDNQTIQKQSKVIKQKTSESICKAGITTGFTEKIDYESILEDYLVKQDYLLSEDLWSRKIVDKFEVSTMHKYIAKKNISNLITVEIPFRTTESKETIGYALAYLVNNNPILRSRITIENSNYYFVEHDVVDNIRLETYDTTKFDYLYPQILDTIKKYYNTLEWVDNSKDMYKIVLIKRSQNDYTLVFLIDHLIFDGGSLQILKKDFYHGLSSCKDNNQNFVLEEKHTYKEYLSLLFESTNLPRIRDFTNSSLFEELEAVTYKTNKITNLIYSRAHLFNFPLKEDYDYEKQALSLALDIMQKLLRQNEFVIRVMCNARKFGKYEMKNVIGDFHTILPMVVKIKTNEKMDKQNSSFDLEKMRNTYLCEELVQFTYMAFGMNRESEESKRMADLYNNIQFQFNFIGATSDISIKNLFSKELQNSKIYKIYSFINNGNLGIFTANGLPIEIIEYLKSKYNVEVIN